MKKTPFEKKIKKILDNQRKNFRIGRENGNKDSLAIMLPLNTYESFEKDLTNDEFYKLKLIFDKYGQTNVLFSIISGYIWFDRCCSDLRLFDSFSDYYIKQILDYGGANISKLFFAQKQNGYRQLEIFDCLSEISLNLWISNFTIDDFIQLNTFLFFVHDTENTSDRYGYLPYMYKSKNVFQKICNLSDSSIAKLLENLDALIIKRILNQLHLINRDIFVIYKKIQKNKLYNVIVKSNFDIFDIPEIYSWLYSNLPTEDLREFLSYLYIEKLYDLRFFNQEICIGIFELLDEEYQKEIFLTEVYLKKGLDGFIYFYKSSSISKKEEILEFLLKDKNKEKLKIANLLLDGKDLSLFEEGLKVLLNI